MGLTNPEDIIHLLIEHGYAEAFRAAFPDDSEPVSPANYGAALQAYQRTLVTPAAFDSYLAGDADALTVDQKQGLDLFISAGCAACHGGKLLGGESLQRFGIVEDYWTATGSDDIDLGLFTLTGEDRHRYVFRTPMLRNITRTGPYFHDGSVGNLREAVHVMATVQLGRALSASEVDRIVAFFESLTGEIPPNYAPPER
jgi:cytochrome c peroxidase